MERVDFVASFGAGVEELFCPIGRPGAAEEKRSNVGRPVVEIAQPGRLGMVSRHDVG